MQVLILVSVLVLVASVSIKNIGIYLFEVISSVLLVQHARLSPSLRTTE